MKRVFSGIQPTGQLHLGNYLGAIRQWVAMQAEYECIYCVVDLHAITEFQPPASLAAGTRAMAAALLACGIDPARAILLNQSRVREHSELAWVLECTARVGWLNRMTQFKDKAGKDREGASVGLYAYPVLQAADILLYKATHVPIGEDQKQHLELARDIATKFNTDFGVDLFPYPEPIIPARAARVMSLRDGTAKMSKSDASDMSRINLTDSADEIANKVRRAKTDAQALPASEAELAERPEARNLVGIYAALGDETPQAVLDRFGGQGFGAFKPALAELLIERLGPISARLRAFEADPGAVDAVLADGAARAAAIAGPVMAEVRRVVGFLG